jgi:hypothetical protein
MALTTDSLRATLTAAIGPETDVNGYIAALVKRGMLPADDAPLNARSVAVALLAVLCGEQPTQAPSAALRLGAFRLRGVAQRYDQVGGAMMLWHDIPEAAAALSLRLWPGSSRTLAPAHGSPRSRSRMVRRQHVPRQQRVDMGTSLRADRGGQGRAQSAGCASAIGSAANARRDLRHQERGDVADRIYLAPRKSLAVGAQGRSRAPSLLRCP